jgi:hypothetical protein
MTAGTYEDNTERKNNTDTGFFPIAWLRVRMTTLEDMGLHLISY